MLGKERDIEVLAECADGDSAIAACCAPARPPSIFTTAFDGHAVHAFEACDIDNLLNPTSTARFAKAIARLRAL